MLLWRSSTVLSLIESLSPVSQFANPTHALEAVPLRVSEHFEVRDADNSVCLFLGLFLG